MGVEPVVAAGGLQIIVGVAAVVRLLLVKLQSQEEHVGSFGQWEPVIVASTVHSSMNQPTGLCPPHNPQIIPPTFSR